MVYLAKESYGPKDAKRILESAQQSVAANIIVRDVRVSESFVELDCSIPFPESIGAVVSVLGRISRPVEYEEIEERSMGKEDAIARAVQCFNSQKYWSAHEALEQVWRRATGPEKTLLNGIILVAAALVHHQKDESEICLSILKRAQEKLRDASGSYHGVNVDKLKEEVSATVASGDVTRFSI